MFFSFWWYLTSRTAPVEHEKGLRRADESQFVSKPRNAKDSFGRSSMFYHSFRHVLLVVNAHIDTRTHFIISRKCICNHQDNELNYNPLSTRFSI